MAADRGVTRRLVLSAGAAWLAPVAAAAGTAPELKRPTVFAAASLTDVLAQISPVWQSKGHAKPVFSFASSAALARQIDAGAPADLFLSADETWMDWLGGRGRLRPGTRRDVTANRLVLVERTASLQPITLGPGSDLAGVLGAGGRLAVGNPASVPAGIYAKQALTTLGLWERLHDRLAPAENVRAALLLVERGEAPAGIVYASDVRAATGLGIAGVFPESSHAPIVYPGAVLNGAAMPQQAEALLAFLSGGTGQAIFHNLGFSSLPAGAR